MENWNEEAIKKKAIEVVLVEDNPMDAELVLRALKKFHVVNNVLHLKNGAEALDYLFARGKYEGRDKTWKPRVILLDLKLPKVDGIEVLRQAKSNENTKTIPIVVLTSSAEQRDLAESYELGANSYITKPVNSEEFFKAMNDLGLYWLMLNKSL